MISNLRYWFLLFLVLLVYVAGMFVTLFENDSAQSAVIAMRMVQENDFVNFFRGTDTYLNGPHLHYWLAAFSFKIFGIHDWAYRIPGIVLSLLGAYSCFGLGKLLYNKKVGRLAALIFMSAQIIVLSNIDVRADTMLTGFSVFAIWQLTRFIEKNSLSGIILGALATGMAFSTKGIIALFIIGLPIFSHLLYSRKWKQFVNWKVLFALLVFIITIAPILYAYNLQLGLRPENTPGGQGERTDLFHIFLEQFFESAQGDQTGQNSNDYFYFFRNFLWVFLPWTIIGIMAYASRLKSFLRLNFRYNPKYEFLTLGGITLIFITFILTQAGLPYTLNPIVPLFSILTASYLYSLYRFRKPSTLKGILGIQFFVLGTIFIVSVLLCYFVFKAENPMNYIWKVGLALIAIFYSLKNENYSLKIITVSVLGSLMLNGVLNTHFFPALLEYQGGSSMTQIVAEKEIPIDNIYKLSGQPTWALDFYNRRPVKQISINKILKKKNIWVYVNELQLAELNNLGYDWDKQFQVDQFKIADLQTKFLDPSTRKGVLGKAYLIHIY